MELYTREKYCFGIRIKSQYAEKLRDTVYVRYRQKKTEPGAPYEVEGLFLTSYDHLDVSQSTQTLLTRFFENSPT